MQSIQLTPKKYAMMRYGYQMVTLYLFGNLTVSDNNNLVRLMAFVMFLVALGNLVVSTMYMQWRAKQNWSTKVDLESDDWNDWR